MNTSDKLKNWNTRMTSHLFMCGGKPSKGTKADRRLAENKNLPPKAKKSGGK